MSQAQTPPVTMAEYQALVRRVENLEKILSQQAPGLTLIESEKSAPALEKATDIRAYTRELQAKYARYPSFTNALRAERRAELEREEKLRSRHVRNNGVSAKRKRTRPGRKLTRTGSKK